MKGPLFATGFEGMKTDHVLRLSFCEGLPGRDVDFHSTIYIEYAVALELITALQQIMASNIKMEEEKQQIILPH